MNKELIIDVAPNEVVTALLEDKRLVELTRERYNNTFSVGDIFLGKIKKIMPGLNAAFVDVGYEKDAFLHYLDLGAQIASLNAFTKQCILHKDTASFDTFQLLDDIPKDGKITDILSTNQQIIVQIAKEPISTKGPKLSCELSFAGRFMVLIPFSDKVSVSQKIKDVEERNRLKEMLRPILPPNFGVIVRTVAENKTQEEVISDLQELLDRWKLCFDNLDKSNPPTRLLGEINRTSAMLRDLLNDSFQGIYINSHVLFEEIKTYIKTIAPEQANIVKLHKANEKIFDYHKVTKQIKTLFGRTVPIEKGGYLIIEHTEAMHVIDVNSGPRQKEEGQSMNALATNIDAASEIARQLKLRDLGGIIVVDFIDMQNPEHREALYQHLKTRMQNDRAKHVILPPSKFGIIEITRQRVRPEVIVQTSERCPTCYGTGEIQASILILDEIENNIRYILKEQNEPELTLLVHPFIESHLCKGWFWNTVQFKWFMKYKKWIKIKSSPSLNFLEYVFYNQHNEEIKF